MLVFIVLALGMWPLVGLVTRLAVGLFGLAPGHPALAWSYPMMLTVCLLLLTSGALRLDGARLRDLGLAPTARLLKALGAGFAASAVVFALVAVVRAASVGAVWQFEAVAGARAAAVALPLAFGMVLMEELLFRGYAFRKAVAAWGAPAALTGSALLFGVYHVIGSGAWGMGAVWLFLTPTLGGLLFGYAMLRTGGLALPTGLHLGGNWINAGVLGLAFPEGGALWTAPLRPDQITALTAPDLSPHLPYLVAVALLAGALLAWPRLPRLRTG